MLKLMLIQRGGATTHKILDDATRFDDFHNLVCYDNFGRANEADEAKGTVYVPHSDTTYTLLHVYGAEANNLQIES